jgi:hypothetical protein
VTESIGGSGQGSASVKADMSVITHKYVFALPVYDSALHCLLQMLIDF